MSSERDDPLTTLQSALEIARSVQNLLGEIQDDSFLAYKGDFAKVAYLLADQIDADPGNFAEVTQASEDAEDALYDMLRINIERQLAYVHRYREQYKAVIGQYLGDRFAELNNCVGTANRVLTFAGAISEDTSTNQINLGAKAITELVSWQNTLFNGESALEQLLTDHSVSEARQVRGLQLGWWQLAVGLVAIVASFFVVQERKSLMAWLSGLFQ